MPRTLAIAAVTSIAISFLTTVSSLNADEPDLAHAKRRAALSWAREEEQRAFDEMLPLATRHDVVLPVCRAVTLRSGALSYDTREFRIEIFQLCDGTIRKAQVSVARQPFGVQLAQLRFRDDKLTLDAALPRLLVDQHDLTSSDARSILRSLDRVRISPNPTQALILDVVSVEINIVAWGEIRIHTYLEDDRPGWRDLAAALKQAMHLSKIDVDQLRFDPHEVEQ